MPLEEEVRWLEASELSDTEGLIALPGSREALTALRGGTFAIVTSGGGDLARMRLRVTGLPVPHVLIAAEDVRHGKPSPEGYQLAASRLGFATADCVVVEDTPPGISAGRAAGARVLAVATTFPQSSLSEADRVVPSLAAVRVLEDAAHVTIA